LIPNEQILIDTLSLQEASDSSAVENIITTHDELFQSDYNKKSFSTVAAKEVHSYVHALFTGFQEMKKNNHLTMNQILRIQSLLEGNRAGFRKLPGTELKNDSTGEVVYTPHRTAQNLQSGFAEQYFQTSLYKNRFCGTRCECEPSNRGSIFR
jgi:Fic family protein